MGSVKWDQIPKEIQGRMLDEQERQGNERNPDVFALCAINSKPSGGFTWGKSKEGADFWHSILVGGKFDVFYEKYPPMTKFEVQNGGITYHVDFLYTKPYTSCIITDNNIAAPERIFYSGASRCSESDVFCYKVGRKVAFNRARLELDKDLRAAVTQEFNKLEGYPYQGVPSELSGLVDEFFEYLDDIFKSRKESKEKYKKFFTEIKEVCEKHGMDFTDFTFKGKQIKFNDGHYEIEIIY